MYEEDFIEPNISKRLKKNPFKTPENYFESIEDRVMQSVKSQDKKVNTTFSGRVIHLLKPALAVAASLTILFMLVYYPISNFTQKEIAKTKNAKTVVPDTMDPYALIISTIDENSLINMIINEEESATEAINPDEVLAYLSSNMNDIEIYTEMQN